MKKFTYILCLLFAVCASCEQKETAFDTLVERDTLFYEINSNKPYTGIVYKQFENQQFEFQGEIKDGQKHGKWTYYLENGAITKEEYYKKNKKHGKVKSFSLNGNYSITPYVNGLTDGKYEFFTKEGKLINFSNYKEGKLNGKSISYYTGTEQERLISEYSKGKLVGESKEFWQNGKLKRLCTFKENKISSEKKYDENGGLLLDAKYPGTVAHYLKGNKKAEGISDKNGRIDIRTLKAWYGEHTFDFNTLTKYIWTSAGKRKEYFSPVKGRYYSPSTRKRWFNSDMSYREGDQAPRSYRPRYKGRFELNDGLPTVSLRITSGPNRKNINIQNWDGKTLEVIEKGKRVYLKPMAK